MATQSRRLDTAELEQRVKDMYEEVALEPGHEFHFETGRALAERLGYDPAGLDAIPPAHADLVEALNQKLLYGTMSASLRGKLVNFLDTQMTGAEHRRKVLDLIHLIAISPEFAVQQ